MKRKYQINFESTQIFQNQDIDDDDDTTNWKSSRVWTDSESKQQWSNLYSQQ
jgi:hypothetical protein